MVASTTSAISGGQFVAKPAGCNRKKLRPRAASPGPAAAGARGQKKPFHVPWNWRIATAASAGPASGSITREEGREEPGAVDPRRLLELARDRQEVLAQQEDARRRDGQHQDHPGVLPTPG